MSILKKIDNFKLYITIYEKYYYIYKMTTFVKKSKNAQLLKRALEAKPENSINESIVDVKVVEEPIQILEDNRRKVIITVLGHSDVGKTSFIQKLGSNIEHKSDNLTKNEASGITQQISAISLDKNTLLKYIPENLQSKFDMDLVLLDSPGHEAFHNIRNIASNISHITLVLIDIIKGVDADTLEFLKANVKNNKDYDKTILVLTKMDKIYGYKVSGKGNNNIKNILKNQKKEVIKHLDNYYDVIVKQVSEIEMYAQPYYSKKDRQCLAMCPISSVCGDGIPDLLLYMSNMKLKIDEEKASIGYIIDKRICSHSGKILIGIMSNGSFSKTDAMKIGKSIFPIKTLSKVVGDVREANYMRTNVVEEANCFMLQIEHNLYDLMDIGTKFETCDGTNILEAIIDKSLVEEHVEKKAHILNSKGVHIVIPSDSMIDGIHSYFSNRLASKPDEESASAHPIDDKALPFTIPILNYSIGTISKKDIFALNNSAKLDDSTYDFRYNCILFCIPDMVSGEQQSNDQLMKQYLDDSRIAIIKGANITCIFGGTIYILANEYEKFLNKCRKDFIDKHCAFSSFKIETMKDHIFRASKPIVAGVKVLDGILSLGSVVTSNDGTEYGTVESIQYLEKDVSYAFTGQEVCCKVSGSSKILDKKLKYEFCNKVGQNKQIPLLVADDIKLYNEYELRLKKDLKKEDKRSDEKEKKDMKLKKEVKKQ